MLKGTKMSKESRKKMSEAKKKNPVRYWLGKKMPKDAVEKMKKKQMGNKYRLGKSFSEESRKKISKTLQRKYKSGELISPFAKMPVRYGKDAPNWKGGKTEPRKDSKYKEWHKAVLKNDNFTCQLCKNKGGKLHVHHFKKWSKFPKARLDIHNGITLCKGCHYRLHKKINIDLRKPFVDTLIELTEKDKDIFLLVNDVGYSYFEKFQEKFPKQFLNAGIIEQTIVGICAGLALMGKKVYYYSMIPFVLMRPYEQLRNDVAYQNLNVKFIGVQGGEKYKFLGESHNIYNDEDIILLSRLPNIRAYIPVTPKETKKVILETYKKNNPAYIRL